LSVRFRTVGDMACTCPVESTAANVDAVVAETSAARVGKRGATRMDDLGSGAALAQEQTLRVAISAACMPRTRGPPEQGFEGNRFTGIPIYDGLTGWELSKADAPSLLIPALALTWTVDVKNKTK
jgi:hypothetical protein